MTVRQLAINPLNLFDLRKVNHCPPHFFAVDFDISTSEKKITDWIYENLQGRFYLGDYYVGANGFKVIKKRAGFEIHGEASYFALILQDINKF
jgi:hypothetical protein